MAVKAKSKPKAGKPKAAKAAKQQKKTAVPAEIGRAHV